MFSTGGPDVKFPMDTRRLHDPDTGTELLLQPTPEWVTQAQAAGGLAAGSQKSRVAIIDSGVLLEHSLIRMCLEPGGAVDFTGEGPGDRYGHGTITALLVLSTWNEPVALLSGKVVPGHGAADPRNLVRAIGWAGDQHVSMIVMRVGVFRRRLGRIVDCDGTCEVCREAAAVLATGIFIDVAGGNTPGRLACPATLGRLGVPGLIAHGPPDKTGVAYQYVGGNRIPYAFKPRELSMTKLASDQMKHAYQLESTDPAAAADAYRRLADSPDKDEAGHALVGLGSMLERLPGRADRAAAADAYRRAIDLHHTSYTPMAQVKLGNLLRAQGDPDGAAAAYRQAIEAGNALYAAMGAFNLGNLLVAEGKPEQAKARFQEAMTSGLPEWTAAAANNLGALLWQQGDLSRALDAFTKAIAAGDMSQLARALLNFGLLSGEMRDLDAARRALEAAASLNDPRVSPQAALELGDLLRSAGQADAARAAYQQAAGSGHPEYGPLARQRLNGS